MGDADAFERVLASEVRSGADPAAHLENDMTACSLLPLTPDFPPVWVCRYGHEIRGDIGGIPMRASRSRATKWFRQSEQEMIQALTISGYCALLALWVLGLLIPSDVLARLPGDGTPRSRYSSAASDAKTAVVQATVYANDKGVYPTGMKVLRESGYANVPDKDPWGNDWVLSPVLTQGSKPREGDEVYVYSKGPKGTGTYPTPFTSDTGRDGSVGYSSVYGSWSGTPPWGVGVTLPPLIIAAVLTIIVYAVIRGMKAAARRRDAPVPRQEVSKRPWYSVSLLMRILLWVFLFLTLLALLSAP